MQIWAVLRGCLAGTAALIVILLAGSELGLSGYTPYFGPIGDRIFIGVYGAAWGGVATLGLLVIWLVLAMRRVRIYWFYVPVLLITVEWLKVLVFDGPARALAQVLLERGMLEVSIAGLIGWLAAFGWSRSVRATFVRRGNDEAPHP